MSKRISVRSIINNPSIIVREDEDLNIENNILILVIKALNKCNGCKKTAIAVLGMPKRTMYNYFERNKIIFDKESGFYISGKEISDSVKNSDRFENPVRGYSYRVKANFK
jgi:hypothetical protein